MVHLLVHQSSHDEYLHFVKIQLESLFPRTPKIVLEYENLILKALLMNLDKAIPLLAPLYSKEMGRPVEFPPVDMLRSTILMVALQVTSLTEWADKLKHNDLLAVLSGFHPGQTPSAANFYAFWDRLWLEDQRLRRAARRKPKKRCKKPRNVKKGKKLPNRHPNVCNRLLRSFRKARFFSKSRPERLLQLLFAKVFVETSIERGILPREMHVTSDGSPFETASSPYGVRVCKCKEHRCDCKRRYSDPEINWGWDSSRNRYYYGRNLYTSTCTNAIYELPVFLRFGQASRHDSVLGLFSIVESTELLEIVNARMTIWVADSAHDAGAYYSLLEDYQIIPIIDLKKKIKLDIGVSLDSDGTPLCPGGLRMINWGIEKKRNRIKWRCPRMAAKKSIRENITCGRSCSSGKYGYCTYITLDWDKRAFPPIPRGTERWKALYKTRTASERINKRYNDYGLDTTRVRGNCRWNHLATLAAINMHLDAWIWQRLAELNVTKQELIAILLSTPSSQVA